ncbi:peroxisome- protein [Rhizophlyctis rosea]|nr:peroxisome- protein [Rhizophlyctis rosea]
MKESLKAGIESGAPRSPQDPPPSPRISLSLPDIPILSKKPSRTNLTDSTSSQLEPPSTVPLRVPSPVPQREDEKRLNLFSMPKHFSKFVNRLTPLVRAHDEFVDILTWRDTFKSGMALMAYALMCIYPTLIFVMPHLILIHYILRAHQQTVAPQPQSPTTTESTDNPPSHQYRRNMQFLQTNMARYSEIYDLILTNRHIVTWNDRALTSKILKLTCASLVVTIITLKLADFRYIMLVLGSGLFLQNNALFGGLALSIISVVMDKVQGRGTVVAESVSAAGQQGRDGDGVCVVFENQRWWAGLGWIPHLLATERAAWTSEDPKVLCPPKDGFPVPAGASGPCAWLDDDWVLDREWTQQDGEGWVYTDYNWRHPRESGFPTAFTRRRRWLRRYGIGGSEGRKSTGVLGEVGKVVKGE